MTDQTPNESEDDVLMGRLAAALAMTDPVPAATSETARGLLRWRSAAADLTTLGLVDVDEVAVRSGSTLQVHRFAGDGLDLELTVDGLSLAGVIEPWSPDEGEGLAADGDAEPLAWVSLESLGGEVEVEVDAEGEFEHQLDSTGPVRLIIRSADHRVRTGWFLISRGGSS